MYGFLATLTVLSLRSCLTGVGGGMLIVTRAGSSWLGGPLLTTEEFSGNKL